MHHQEHSFDSETNSKLNWLRAAVLGANDGIVSVAALIVGVAGAANSKSVILTAGIAGLTAGALSMAAGEYVSVSSQRDTEKALGKKGKHLTNPWDAAIASAGSFFAGAAIPLGAVLLSPAEYTVLITFVASLVALAITGAVSGRVSGASVTRATIRVTIGGAVAMLVTFGIGSFFGSYAI